MFSLLPTMSNPKPKYSYSHTREIVKSPSDFNWTEAKYKRPGSGNLVYGNDAIAIHRDTESHINWRGMKMALVIVTILFTV